METEERRGNGSDDRGKQDERREDLGGPGETDSANRLTGGYGGDPTSADSPGTEASRD